MIANMMESIKKTMGWCPNANIMEKRKVHFNDLSVNVPGNGESPHAVIKWKNRERNRVLILCILNTYFAISSFSTYKLSMHTFIAGFSIGIAANAICWKFEWHELDKIAGSKMHVRDQRQLVFYILIIPVLIVFDYLMSNYGMVITISALSGFMVTTWIAYLQVVYWELKNKKVIVTRGFLWQTLETVSSEG